MITRRGLIKGILLSGAGLLLPGILFAKEQTKWRTCEYWKDGKWEKVSMKNIKKGDIFRLWEGDKIVEDGGGYTSFRADKDAKPCDPPGNHMVHSTAVKNPNTME
jgi:hypothetical protein